EIYRRAPCCGCSFIFAPCISGATTSFPFQGSAMLPFSPPLFTLRGAPAMKGLPERMTLDAASRNRIQWLRHVAATVSKRRHPSGGDVIYRALVAYVREIEQGMREGDRDTLEDEASWMLADRCYRD